MKKTASWLTVALLALGLVAVGCSSSKSAEEEREDMAEQKMKEETEDAAKEGMEKAQDSAEKEMEKKDAEMAKAEKGPAIGGYCPVAYKMAGKPVKGQKEFAVEHGGKTWHLANEKAMKAFKENPGKYEVKYAGWCATGLSMGKQVKADPTIFMVHNDKIYLFSSEEAKKKFSAKADEMAKKAESNWTAMKSEGGEAKAEGDDMAEESAKSSEGTEEKSGM